MRLKFAAIAFVTLGLIVGGVIAFACLRSSDSPNDKVVLQYWEQWTGFEADAMRKVVDDFNASQSHIYVEYSSISDINRKLMLATAGGIPPDIAGLESHTLPTYAENNALLPLDAMAAQGGIKEEQYTDIFWRMCRYKDHLWALPSTPASIALIWNKKLFRQAGLDPEKPPRSIAELEQMNEKLTKWAPDGSLEAMGHSPQEPGWYGPFWGNWFGGKLWDGEGHITANSPENIAAFQWLESYPKRFGAGKLLSFQDGSGNFASPQNAFFTGRVAMVLQGPWIYNFIKNYGPADFEWGVAPFPSADPDRLKDVTIVESCLLVIPHGASHPREAFQFISYVNTQKPMEKLCLGQQKFSPLRTCSPDFFANHPNPHIAEFARLAQSPNAQYAPDISTWNEYNDDMLNALNRVWTGHATAAEALDDVQAHQQYLLDRRIARWNRVARSLTDEWSTP
jgi:multiple sugar transport system substrate-binding protein